MRVPVINIVLLLNPWCAPTYFTFLQSVLLLNPWCAPPYFSFLQNALFLLVLSMHYRI